jgi:TolB-like protein
MRLRTLSGFLFLGILSTAGASFAQEAAETAPEGPTSVLIFNLESDEDLKDLAKSLTEELILHLGQKSEIAATGESEIAVMLAHEKDKKLLMCKDDRSCLAQISSALNASKAVVGRVGRLGTSYVATLKLTDTKKVSVESAESISTEDAKELPELMRAAADRLLGLSGARAAATFKLEVGTEGTSAAVLDLEGHGVSAATAANLTDLLSLELKKFKGLNVVSRSEIQAMLQYQTDKMVLQCSSDTSCLIEIGGALGVDYLVSGSIGRLGESLVVSLKLLSIHEAKVTSRVSETFEGDEGELVRALRFASQRLLGKQAAGNGSLTAVSNVDAGLLTLNGAKEMKYPLPGPVAGLPVGKHGIDFKAKGYYSMYKEGYVEPGTMTQIRFELIPLPTPWYKKWWVWTVAGTALAGGITTAVLLSTQEPTTGVVNVQFLP